MATMSFPDQMGSVISLPEYPKRIVSLVPSQTELLADLGLTDEVVGITKFCVHPEGWLSQKPSVGGTKKFNFDLIKQVSPDLIIGNKEENYLEGIRQLQKSYPVWMSDITNLDDALSMINSVGSITNKTAIASDLCLSIEENFNKIRQHAQKSVLYLIWRQPWMAAGMGTFIHDMLFRIGLVNAVGDRFRYPMLSDAELQKLSPDYIFLSTEPYPFEEKHFKELKKISPASVLKLVDGEMFSWYGSRLVRAPDYFNTLALV
jgi:ABC-type Fe3+-hydroxamate transport system substrate-binding protein